MNDRGSPRSLAKRITWLFGLIAGLAIVLLSLSSYSLLVGGFERVEAHELDRNFHRVASAIRVKASELHERSTDWAAWDDAYDFLQNGNERFIKSNLSQTAQADLGVHYAAYVRPNGQVVFEILPELHDKAPRTTAKQIWDAAGIESALSNAANHPKGGIVQVEGQLMAISMRPVIDTERIKPPNGWLIWGRFFTASDINQVNAITGLKMRVAGLPASGAPNSLAINPVSVNKIEATGRLVGLQGQPVAMLTVQDNRKLMHRAQGIAAFCISVLAALATILVAALYFVVQRLVLSRVLRLRRQIDNVRLTQGQGAVSVDGDDEISHLGEAMQEMVERIISQNRDVEILAYYDALTNLPNRTKFELDFRCAQEQGCGDRGVLLLDVDDFQTVNETLGHPFGDEFLLALCQRLAGLCGDGVHIYRAGSDAFILVLNQATTEVAVEAEARRLVQLISTPITVGERLMDVSICAGGTVAFASNTTVDDVLRQTDTALHEAKSRGTSQVAMFNHGMVERAIERLDLEFALRRAVGRQEFRLHYQPIVSMHSAHVYGAEALVRWDHPQFGLVSPLKFIPMAERTGMIVEIGQWVLEQALRDLRAWSTELGLSTGVSINVSMRQLVQKGYAKRLGETVQSAGIDPSKLTIEVTESMAIADMDAALKVLNEIREVGVRLAMDDFGVGYSSLSSLQELPFDIIKIDKSFVQKVTENDTSLAVVRSIISLCHALGLRVTGEGIETLDHYEVLRQLECDFGQGYLFARPLPIEEFLCLVHEYDNCSILRAA